MTEQIDMIPLIGVITAAYLVGAIPFGLVMARLFGLGDIRTIGSGNIGATNVLRTGHKPAALLTLLLDSGKGLMIVVIIRLMGGDDIMLAAAAVASIFGHCYPVWLRFRGGKGVATGIGVFLGLDWLAGILICLLWLAVAVIFRLSSVSALVSYLSAPVLIGLTAYWRGDDMPFALIYGAGIMACLATWRHRSNISRVLAGKEPKIGQS
jgi:glycerol-3-phosphate acyltransferase PlsY